MNYNEIPVGKDPQEGDEFTAEELINRIYDTLMQNVGMSIHHTAFPIDEIDYSEVDGRKHEMYFRIGDRAYTLTIKNVDIR